MDSENSLKTQSLLKDLIDKSIRMCERKYTKKIEDIHNDDFTDWLRDRGYNISDQTRSGRSLKGSGELNIMIREENGTPISIIEAFRLSSCGEENKEIVSHINKLINDYDTIGHLNNYIIVYAEAKDFSALWNNYFQYVKNINSNVYFNPSCQLNNFIDITSFHSDKSDLRIGQATHIRNDKEVNIFHIFINMFSK